MLPAMANEQNEFLRLYLSERDVACPGCGYNLRGLTGDACPECGQALRLSVGLVEPKLGSFLAGLIGLVLGLGFHGFLMVWVLWMSITSSFGSWRDLWPVVIGGVLTLIGTLGWLKWRGRIRRLGSVTKAGLITACWIVSIGTVLWFFVIAS